MRPAVIFLSYRRDDTGPFALALRAELELRLDGIPIFLDVSRIQGGDQWAAILDDALAKATILIALIGPNWTGEAADKPPRIEAEDDWVRREVARALAHPSDAVLPVLMNGATIPEKARLPEELWKLFEAQAVPLRAKSWNSDVENLCNVLEKKFLVRVKHLDDLFPSPSVPKTREKPLSDEELGELTRQGLLTGWEVEIIHDVWKTGFVREFLRKRFKCRGPSEAFAFVDKIMPITKALVHHPIIEIMFQSVLIRLSTFDAGHRITSIDRIMAGRIDAVFQSLGRRSRE